MTDELCEAEGHVRHSEDDKYCSRCGEKLDESFTLDLPEPDEVLEENSEADEL